MLYVFDLDGKKKPRRLPARPYPALRKTLCVHWLSLAAQQLPQHILQNAAVGVVLGFLRRIDAQQGFEGDRFFTSGRLHLDLAARGKLLDRLANAADLEDFLAG